MKKTISIKPYQFFFSLKKKVLFILCRYFTIKRVVEWEIKHLLKVTQALLFQTHVPKSYQGEVVLMSTCLINQIPSMVPGFKSLISVFSNHFPDFHITCELTLKVFRCVSFIHIHAHNRGKVLPMCFEVRLCMLFYHKKKRI